jgi:hypothetical protein
MSHTLIEILTKDAHPDSIAVRESTELLRLAGEGFTSGKLHQVVVMSDMTVFLPVSEPLGPGDGFEAGTVSSGDKILIDGEVHTVSSRQYNSPKLVRTDS